MTAAAAGWVLTAGWGLSTATVRELTAVWVLTAVWALTAAWAACWCLVEAVEEAGCAVAGCPAVMGVGAVVEGAGGRAAGAGAIRC